MVSLDRVRCDAGPTMDFHDESCPAWCEYGHPGNHAPVPARTNTATSVYDDATTHLVTKDGAMPHALTALTGDVRATIVPDRVTCAACIDYLRSQQ